MKAFLFIFSCVISWQVFAQCNSQDLAKFTRLSLTTDTNLKAKNYPAAREQAKELLKVAERLGTWDGMIIANNLIVQTYFNESVLDSALHYAKRSIQWLDQENKHTGLFARIGAYYYYGAALVESGSYQEGLRWLEKAPGFLDDPVFYNTDYAPECGDTPWLNDLMKKAFAPSLQKFLGYIYNYAGIAAMYAFDLNLAIRYFEQALNYYENINFQLAAAEIYINMASAYQAIFYETLGHTNKVELYLKKGMDILAELENLQGAELQAAFLYRLRNVQQIKELTKDNKIKVNEAWADKAIELIGSADSLLCMALTGVTPGNLQRIFMAEKALLFSLQKQTAQSKKLVETIEKGQEPPTPQNTPPAQVHPVAGLYAMLGQIALHNKEYKETAQYLKIAWNLLHSGLSVEDVVKSKKTDQISPRHYELTAFILLAYGQMLEGNFRAKKDDPENLIQALAYHEAGLELFTSKKADFTRAGIKPTLKTDEIVNIDYLLNNFFDVAYVLASKIYYLNKDKLYLEKAYRIAEQSRSFALRKSVRDLVLLKDIPLETRHREENLRQNLLYQEKQVFWANRTEDETNIKTTQEHYHQVYNDLQNYMDELMYKYPKYYNLKYRDSITSWREVSASLDANAAMIQYFTVGDQQLYAVVILPGQDLQLFSLSSKTSLPVLIDHMTRQVQHERFADQDTIAENYIKNAVELYKVLLEPLLPTLKKAERLIILPDDYLHQLNFELLLTNTPKSYKTDGLVDGYLLPYLVRQKAISYAPSATILQDLKKIKVQSDKPLLEYGAFEPDYSTWNVELLRTYGIQRTKTFDNVYEIQKGFKVGETKVWIDSMATKQAFSEALEQFSFRVLHFSGHSFLDYNRPLWASLAFAALRDDSTGFMMTAAELYNRSVSAQLVLLGSCNSGGNNAIQPGEGMPSIARGFAYAGCPSVIMSMWETDNSASREIIQSLLKYLKKGMTYDVALQQAKLDYLKDTNKSVNRFAPSLWAPLIAWGDMRSFTF